MATHQVGNLWRRMQLDSADSGLFPAAELTGLGLVGSSCILPVLSLRGPGLRIEMYFQVRVAGPASKTPRTDR